MKHLGDFKSLGLPLVVGISRKRMIGDILDKPVDDRALGSVILATLALQAGAAIIRVHDVEQTSQAAKLYSAVQAAD